MAEFKFNGNIGLTKLLQLLKGKFETKVDKVDGKALSTNDFTNELKAKLEGVAENANKYEHATHTSYASGFYKVTVDAEGHVSKAEAVTKADITNLGIPGQDTTYVVATQDAAGLMAAADKKKLDGVAENANNYSHPEYAAKASGFYKVTVDGSGHVSAVENVSKEDIVALGIPAQDTTYGQVTQSADGLMIAADKAKLDGIAEGANKYEHPTYEAKASGFYKITVDETGHISATSALTKEDIVALGIPGELTPLSIDISADAESDEKAATPKAVKTYVDSQVASTYKPSGSVAAISELGALSKANVGRVYNMTAEFTTTDAFVEGAGKKYPAGTNVVIVNPTGTTYQYDVLAGFIDLSPYAKTEDISELSEAEVQTIWDSVFTA